EIAHLIGECRAAGEHYSEAAQAFATACRLAPERIDSPTRLANLLRHRLNQTASADQVMEKLVAANPQNVRAWLARGLYRKELGALADAEKDVQRALELAPQDADALLGAAELALVRGDHDQARTDLQRGW